MKPGLMAPSHNPNTQEAEAGSPHVWDRFRLQQNEILSQKRKKTKLNFKKR